MAAARSELCRRGGMADAEDLKSSGGNPVWVRFPPPVISHDRGRKRTEPYSASVSRSFTQVHSNSSTRMDANDRGRKRIAIATKSATAPADDDMDAIVDAWSTLPDAIEAGVLAMVKAAVR